MPTLIHIIDKKEKIKFHTKCPVCGKEYYRDKLLPSSIKQLQTKELVLYDNILEVEVITMKCCHFKFEYHIHWKKLWEENQEIKLRNVNEEATCHVISQESKKSIKKLSSSKENLKLLKEQKQKFIPELSDIIGP